MESVRSCVRAFAAIAFLAMGVHFAPVEASVPTHGSLGTACDIAHRADKVAPVDQAFADEFDLADRNSAPICPTGGPCSAGVACCGSVVLTTPSLIPAVISAAGDSPDEIDRSLSGVEPDAPQEPPQHSA